jgi:hypothetical protein
MFRQLTKSSKVRVTLVNTSAAALRVVGRDEKETQCLGVQLGHPVPGGYKYGDLVLQIRGVSNLRQ